MKFKALGCICIIEIAGTIGAVMKNPAAAGICLTGTCFLTGYTAYLEMRRMQIKICPECKCEIQKSYRICPECGHLFQTGISNEKLTDFIEKEKEAEMTSAQIDKDFEKIETISIEDAITYEEQLNDIFQRKNI